MSSSSSVYPVYARQNISFEKGEGVYLYGNDGHRYLDLVAGVAANSLGHCHPSLIKALTDQANKLWHISNVFQIKELEKFANHITSLTFPGKIFCTNSGTEATECGIKTTRKYFSHQNSKRYKIITFNGAFHGRTMAAISSTGDEKLIAGFEPRLPGFTTIDPGNLAAVEKSIDDETAGIMIEPAQGDGGVFPMKKEFLEGLRTLCDKHSLLLIFDEVQVGAGRTGHLYAYQHYNVQPDILLSAKGIGGGFPVGFCLATNKVAEAMTLGSHGSTFGNNPLAMSVANAVLDIISKPEFLKNVQERATQFRAGLDKIAAKYPNIIKEVRSIGLLLGCELHAKYEMAEFIKIARENKLLLMTAKYNTIRILPALIITADQVNEALTVLEKVTSELAGR